MPLRKKRLGRTTCRDTGKKKGDRSRLHRVTWHAFSGMRGDSVGGEFAISGILRRKGGEVSFLALERRKKRDAWRMSEEEKRRGT